MGVILTRLSNCNNSNASDWPPNLVGRTPDSKGNALHGVNQVHVGVSWGQVGVQFA